MASPVQGNFWVNLAWSGPSFWQREGGSTRAGEVKLLVGEREYSVPIPVAYPSLGKQKLPFCHWYDKTQGECERMPTIPLSVEEVDKLGVRILYYGAVATKSLKGESLVQEEVTLQQRGTPLRLPSKIEAGRTYTVEVASTGELEPAAKLVLDAEVSQEGEEKEGEAVSMMPTDAAQRVACIVNPEDRQEAIAGFVTEYGARVSISAARSFMDQVGLRERERGPLWVLFSREGCKGIPSERRVGALGSLLAYIQDAESRAHMQELLLTCRAKLSASRGDFATAESYLGELRAPELKDQVISYLVRTTKNQVDRSSFLDRMQRVMPMLSSPEQKEALISECLKEEKYAFCHAPLLLLLDDPEQSVMKLLKEWMGRGEKERIFSFLTHIPEQDIYVENLVRGYINIHCLAEARSFARTIKEEEKREELLGEITKAEREEDPFCLLTPMGETGEPDSEEEEAPLSRAPSPLPKESSPPPTGRNPCLLM